MLEADRWREAGVATMKWNSLLGAAAVAALTVLPAHAQNIYKDAFNNAWEEYGHDESRAHAVAWGAVKKKYHKNLTTGKWEEGASD